MDPNLILDKLSHARVGGLAGLGDEEIRARLDSQTTAPCLYSRHVLDSIITGPRADGQILHYVQEYSVPTGVGPTTTWLAPMSRPRFSGVEHEGGCNPLLTVVYFAGR